MEKKKFPWIKFIVGCILFAFFHQLYDIFPSTIAAVLAEGAGESIFQHLKMLFYPYLLLSIIDYFLYRRKGQLTESFIYARMLILISVPWIMISFFYVPESVGINFGEPGILIFSIIASWIGVYTAIRLEEPLEAAQYRPAVKALLIMFFLSAIIIFTGFTFNTPLHDFF